MLSNKISFDIEALWNLEMIVVKTITLIKSEWLL